MAQNFRMDLATQLVIATSAVDASVTIPKQGPGNFPTTKYGSWWKIGVAGQPAYINVNAAATSANILFPIGIYDDPVWLDEGSVVHAITAAGSGQVWFVRCYLTMV